jgi:nitrite reductase (NADH) large subunit
VRTLEARKAWKCDVCGYVHEGDVPPEVCPVCGATADMFSPMMLAGDGDTAVSVAGIQRLVVVGGGIAGLTAAEHARKVSSDLAISLVVRPEEGLPYYRLNLSRLVSGEIEATSLPMKDAAWFAAQRIDVVFAEVVSVDRDASEVRLADGRMLGFDRLVLATGSTSFVPPIPGVDEDRVLVLRTRADAERLLARATPRARCVCIGGGLLGLEAAGGLARRGVQVTVLETASSLLPRQLAAPAGRLVEAHLRGLGVETRRGVKIIEIAHESDRANVALAGGETLPADFVLIAAGVRSDVRLAKAAGLTIRNGLVVDDHTATSDPRIFAAGDVAAWRGVVYGIWPAAYAQGVVAGRNAAGATDMLAPFTPSNRLRVVSQSVFSAGEFAPSDPGFSVVERETERTYVRLVTRDGRLAGVNLVGDTGLDAAVAAAIEVQRPIAEIPEIVSYLGQPPR